MIVQFRPLTLDLFEGNFDGHVIQIRRLVTFWRIFVDGKPVNRPASLSPKHLIRQVESAAEKVVASRMATKPKVYVNANRHIFQRPARASSN